MGRVAAELADRAIVTTDNPRSEDPAAIAAEVAAAGGSRSCSTAAPRSRRRSRTRARRRRRDRRQGRRHRDGARRPAASRSTTAQVVREVLRVIPLELDVARAARAAASRARGPTRSPACRSTRAASRRATSSSRSAAAPTSSSTRSPAARRRRSCPSDAHAALAAIASAVRERSQARVVGDHRLDRQDVDEGHPVRALRAARAHDRERGQLQQRARRAADALPARGRHRALHHRDGDARPRADRAGSRRSRGRTSA